MDGWSRSGRAARSPLARSTRLWSAVGASGVFRSSKRAALKAFRPSAQAASVPAASRTNVARHDDVGVRTDGRGYDMPVGTELAQCWNEVLVVLHHGSLELTRFRRQSRYAATFAAACCFSKSIGLT
jgi:hypothetical protein